MDIASLLKLEMDKLASSSSYWDKHRLDAVRAGRKEETFQIVERVILRMRDRYLSPPRAIRYGGRASRVTMSDQVSRQIGVIWRKEIGKINRVIEFHQRNNFKIICNHLKAAGIQYFYISKMDLVAIGCDSSNWPAAWGAVKKCAFIEGGAGNGNQYQLRSVELFLGEDKIRKMFDVDGNEVLDEELLEKHKRYVVADRQW